MATLRLEAGRDPYDKELTDLVGALSTRSDAFRVRWAATYDPGDAVRTPDPASVGL